MNKSGIEHDQWSYVISPHRKWYKLNLKELWDYRDLIIMFIKRDFTTTYKQTILGPLWFVIQPILTTIMYTIVFTKVAKLSTDGLPPILFYLSGITCWSYFSDCVIQTSTTFTSNAIVFGKVYFPRIVSPLALVTYHLIKLSFQFLLFIGLLFFFILKGAPIHPNFGNIVFIPVLGIIMGTLGLGIGLIISSLTTKYRDFALLVGFGVQLFMYVTPVIYPLSSVPAKLKPLLLANPMTSVIETIRYTFLGTGEFSILNLGIALCVSFVFLTIGMLMFSSVERTFMDTV